MTRSTLFRLLVVSSLASLAAGCGGSGDELDAYINDVKSRSGGSIDPLPEIIPYEGFSYEAAVEGVRSPFRPDAPQSLAGGPGSVTPDDERVPEYLENFPLDSLRMVGTLDIDDTMYGLVQDSDSLIHRVIPGNYLGQSDGRITEISESQIVLVEIISDGIGGYIERDAAISLSN